jgi:ribosomal protein S18 acetylase RimI-like enzyme
MQSSESTATTSVTIVQADLGRSDHQWAILDLIDAYACDPMGSGQPLPADIKSELIPALRRHPTTLILLAYNGERPVGIAACFLGFSTFAARPLVNVHDLAVLPEYRGRGIGQLLLAAVERKARELGCCKVTLEVQENNVRARHSYEAAGFKHALADTETGGCLFMSKRL